MGHQKTRSLEDGELCVMQQRPNHHRAVIRGEEGESAPAPVLFVIIGRADYLIEKSTFE